MTKLIQAAFLTVVGLAALIAAGPTLVRLIQTLIPLVLVIGVVTVVVRVVWVSSRRW